MPRKVTKKEALNMFIKNRNLNCEMLLIDFEKEFKKFLQAESNNIYVTTQNNKNVIDTDPESSATYTITLINKKELTNVRFVSSKTINSKIIIGIPKQAPPSTVSPTAAPKSPPRVSPTVPPSPPQLTIMIMTQPITIQVLLVIPTITDQITLCKALVVW